MNTTKGIAHGTDLIWKCSCGYLVISKRADYLPDRGALDTIAARCPSCEKLYEVSDPVGIAYSRRVR